MKGKEKCKALKEIRQKIADENDIPYVVEECTHKGECKGTCPKCESELRYLEKELAKKEKIGKKLAVVGVSMGIAASFAGCDFDDAMEVITYPGVQAIHAIEDTFNIGGVEGDTGYEYDGGLEWNPDYVLEGEPIEDPGYELDGDVQYIPEDDFDDSCNVDGINLYNDSEKNELDSEDLDSEVQMDPETEDGI